MLRTTCPSSLFVKYLKYVQDRTQQHSVRHRVGPMRPYPSLRIYSVKGWGRECHFLDMVVPIFQKINILTVVRLIKSQKKNDVEVKRFGKKGSEREGMK